MAPNDVQIQELVLQALETELGGVEIYRTAIKCAINKDLRGEWEKYLGETQRHLEIVTKLCEDLEIDPAEETPGREIVRALGRTFVEAMTSALKQDKGAAQLVACECVVMAETKDHQNWSLLGEVGHALEEEEDDQAQPILEAWGEVEDQEDEHLYHTQGWCRELWLDSLGLDAKLPPPEEKKHVKTALGAAKAKASRKK